MTTPTQQLTELERAVRRARHVVRNPAANPALDAKHVAPLLAEFDRREDEIDRLTAQRDAVLALHRPAPVGRGRLQGEVCVECTSGGDPYTVVSSDWPCPTAAALGGVS